MLPLVTPPIFLADRACPHQSRSALLPRTLPEISAVRFASYHRDAGRDSRPTEPTPLLRDALVSPVRQDRCSVNDRLACGTPRGSIKADRCCPASAWKAARGASCVRLEPRAIGVHFLMTTNAVQTRHSLIRRTAYDVREVPMPIVSLLGIICRRMTVNAARRCQHRIDFLPGC